MDALPDPRHAARDGLGPAAGVALDASGRAVGALFGAVSALRRAKSLHPHGAVYEGALELGGGPPAPQACFLSEAGEHPALVRFSRSLGTPRPLPDLLGISLRLPHIHGPERHQDLLLVTSADLPLVHHAFLPADDVQQRPYSSSLPYRAGDERFLVGALPRDDSPRLPGSDMLERLDAAARTGRLAFDLAVAPLMGRFEPVGRIRIGAKLPDELDATRFSPWNTGGGLAPAGDVFNRLRGYAYPMSQAGWSPAARAEARGAERRRK
jgi:hypothetical protein